MSKATIKVISALLLLALTVVLCVSCAQSRSDRFHDGYYSAEFADFDAYGWKEYITIYISDDTIVTVEYNAKNASGFIKSWDMDYMRKMNATDGTYPNEYTRAYAEKLVKKQDPYAIDAISGATSSYISFQRLADAAMAKAAEGDKTVAFVDIDSD